MTKIPTLRQHGARAIECVCPGCDFMITDPRCAVLVDDVLAIVCPKCGWHVSVDCKKFRRTGEST